MNNYRERLTTNAKDFDTIVAEMLAEMDALQKRLDKIDRVAAAGTVDGFLSLSNEQKRLWFAIHVEEANRRKQFQTSLELLAENSYDHHTPHMICVPTEKWKQAMKVLDEIGLA